MLLTERQYNLAVFDALFPPSTRLPPIDTPSPLGPPSTSRNAVLFSIRPLPYAQVEFPYMAVDAPNRTGFLRRPEHTSVIVRAGYSAICEIEGRPGVLLKVPLPFAEYDEAIEIEKRIYRRLGKHANIVNVIEMNEWGIYLEQAVPGNLRLYYRDGGRATAEERIRWCHDVAKALDYVHQHNIRHADLSGKNLLLDGRNILLCDFGGSSIDNDKATIVAETGFRHYDRKEYLQPTMRSEIHSLGSTIYEIVTGRKPFHVVEDRDLEIEAIMRDGHYPDVKSLPLGDVITKCWAGRFNSALSVAQDISYASSKYLAQDWPSLPLVIDPTCQSPSI